MKKYCNIIVTILFLFFMSVRSYADSNIKGGNFLRLDTNELGTIDVYISSNHVSDFMSVNDLPVNMYSSTVYGYVFNSNGHPSYTIYFYSLDSTYGYRVYGTSYNTNTLTVSNWKKSESTLSIKEFSSSYERIITYVLIGVLGILVISIFYKR